MRWQANPTVIFLFIPYLFHQVPLWSWLISPFLFVVGGRGEEERSGLLLVSIYYHTLNKEYSSKATQDDDKPLRVTQAMIMCQYKKILY